MKILTFVFIIILVFNNTYGQTKSNSKSIGLKGEVTDIDTKQPLSGVKVELINETTGKKTKYITDESGMYKFDRSSNCSYKITASKKNYLGTTADESTIGLDTKKLYFRDFALKKKVK